MGTLGKVSIRCRVPGRRRHPDGKTTEWHNQTLRAYSARVRTIATALRWNRTISPKMMLKLSRGVTNNLIWQQYRQCRQINPSLRGGGVELGDPSIRQGLARRTALHAMDDVSFGQKKCQIDMCALVAT
jgi:hypothetical protein